MSKKFQNTPREFDFTAVAQQLADSAGVDPALLTQVYGDPLLQHAEQYQASQTKEARPLSPFVQATINAAFADNPAVMTAAGWEHDDNGNLQQTKFNSEEVAYLNKSLAQLAAIPSNEMLDHVVWNKLIDPIVLPFIGRIVKDARRMRNIRKGVKYAVDMDLPPLPEISSAPRSGDASEKAQVAGEIKAHLQPAKIGIDRELSSAKDGVYRTAPLQEIFINPTSDNMKKAAKYGDAAVGQGFANGGPLNLTAQNASGVSPRVATIVEKYGLDNIRNYFDGGDVLLHKDDEQQRLAKKKAEAIRRFKAWIPNIENAAKVGYDAERDRWYPYESVEGDSPTIQYGLKLDMANPEMDELLKTQLDEQGRGYLTSEQANYFLDEDIDRRYGQAEAIYDAKRGKGAWDKLSPYSQSLLLDFQFNPGLSKFPKMMNGYDTGNKAQIQAEIGRTYKDALGVCHPLKDRNEKMKLKTDSLETFYPIFDPFVVK